MVPVTLSRKDCYYPHFANEESDTLENSKVELSLRTAENKEIEAHKADIWEQLPCQKIKAPFFFF